MKTAGPISLFFLNVHNRPSIKVATGKSGKVTRQIWKFGNLKKLRVFLIQFLYDFKDLFNQRLKLKLRKENVCCVTSVWLVIYKSKLYLPAKFRHYQVKPQEQKLLIQVFDENRLTRDDFLGMVEIPLNNTPFESAATPRPPLNKYPLRPRRSV